MPDLGGAVAAHVGVGGKAFTSIRFRVYPGIVAWGGLRLRALISSRL